MKKNMYYFIVLSLFVTQCTVYKTLYITSEPQGIKVSRGGGVIGVTPFSLKVPAGDIFFCSPWYWTFQLEARSQIKQIDPCGLYDGATVCFSFPENGQEKKNNPPQKVVSTGTGFFLNHDGLIITSYHVIDGSQKISVLINDTSLSATLNNFSKGTDIAVLKVDCHPDFFIPLELDSIHLGDEVYTIGFPVPGLLGNNKKYSNGTINSLSGIQGDNSLLQISIPIQPGNSGGPLCNKKGHAIGIITSTAAIEYFFSKTGSIPQNINWATKIEYAKPLLDNNYLNEINKKDLSIDEVGRAVVFIVAE